MKTDENLQRFHFHLIAGNVVYQELSAADQPTNPIGVMTLNTVVATDTDCFAVRHIAQAQQGLQKRFYEQTGDNMLKVIDVVLINVSYLGDMTNEEFHAPPKGTKETTKETLQ